VFNVVPLCKESVPKVVVSLVHAGVFGSRVARMGHQPLHVGEIAAGIEALFRDILFPEKLKGSAPVVIAIFLGRGCTPTGSCLLGFKPLLVLENCRVEGQIEVLLLN